MHIVLSESKSEAISTVVEHLLDFISRHPTAVIGLATGRTMEPLYELWILEAQKRRIDHGRCFFFMLDEYVGLTEGHPSSFKSYIEKRFQAPLGLRLDQFAFPPAHLEEGAAMYEELLKQSGGIDIQLLGIGTNGHVGFNEPGSLQGSRTRIVRLTEETREANRSQFDGEMPRDALSMGIATILDAKSLWMLVTGKSKAPVIKYLMNHHDDPDCPATFLKFHPHFNLVLDPDAASSINLKI